MGNWRNEAGISNPSTPRQRCFWNLKTVLVFGIHKYTLVYVKTNGISYFVTALLICIMQVICNLHSVKFTHLKCAIQWILVYSQSCASVSQSTWEHFHRSKKNPEPINSHSHSLSPSPWQPLTDFLSLCICPFWAFRMNGTAHSVVFGDQLLSRYMILFFFLKEFLYFHYLFIYLFIFGCVGSSFLCEGFL